MDEQSATPFSPPFSVQHNPAFSVEWSPTPTPRIIGENSPATRQNDGNSAATPRGVKLGGVKLTTEEKIAIFNSCLELQQEWLQGSNKEEFWKGVARRFEASTGRDYTWQSCRRTAKAEVERRREYLQSYETGKANEPHSDLDEAIDLWIEILEQREAIQIASKASAQHRLLDAAIDTDFRQQMTETIGQTRTRNESVDSSTTSNTIDTEDSGQPRRRRRNRSNSEERALTAALTKLATQMSKRLESASQRPADASALTENVERRLEHLESNYSRLETNTQRTNELLERLITRLA